MLKLNTTLVLEKRIDSLTFTAAPLGVGAALFITFHLFEVHYLFHVVVELLTASICFGMWIIGLNTYKISRNHFFAFLGIAFGFVGGFDLLHALAALLGDPEGSPSLSQLLWYASRLVESLSLAVSVFFVNRTLKPALVILGYSLVCAGLLYLVFWHTGGLIPDGWNIAYVDVSLFSLAAFLLILRRRQLTSAVYRFMLLAVLAAVGCELMLLDAPVESTRFIFAHLLNYLSFYFIYKALVETTLQSPFKTLFLSLTSVNEGLKSELAAREKAESALRISEQNYRLLIRALPDFLFRISADGTILEVVPTRGLISYLSPDDKEKNIADALPRDLGERFKKKTAQALKENREIIFEYRIAIGNGKFDREARLVPHGNGEVLAIVRDTTERNKNLAEIRMLYHAIRQSASTVVITDTKGNIVYVNPKFSETTGYSAEEALGQNVRIMKSGFHGQEYYKNLWETVLAGKDWRGEFQNKKKNGEIYWEQAVISPFRNAKGEITRVVAVKEDITERIEAVRRLRESENRFRAIVEQSSDGIFVFDPSTQKLQEANRRFWEMLGYEAGDAEKFLLSDLCTDDLTNDCLAALEAGETVSGLRRFKTKDGSLRLGEISASMVQFATKLVILVNVRDVTESCRQQEALEKELMLAANVQQSFLRSSATDKRVGIQTIYRPVHQVSGDLFGYRWVNNGDVLYGFLFDIMGHGLSTALKTSALMILFLQAAEKDLSLQEKMAWVNRESMRLFTDDSFAAAICFELDLERRKLSYVSGGITHFLASTSQFSGQVECEGDLLGLNPTATFDEKIISVNKDDKFFFITDGLLDRLTPENLALADFAATVKEMRRLSAAAKRKDDCSALCLTIRS